MEYNTQREQLTIPEYGRNIQKMINHAMTLEDREERNKMAQAIVRVMEQVNPDIRILEDFKHKLWDHMYIISGFQLDVDSPYPKPSEEAFNSPPERVAYPSKKIKYRHYGKVIESLIEKCANTENEEERDAFTLSIANLMKRAYINWNRDSVNDEVILKHLKEMSDGKLELKDPSKMVATSDILRSSGSNNQNKKRHQNKKGGKNNNKRRKN